MIATVIRERLNREPFQPFVIRSSSGKGVVVSSPDLAVLMKSEVFVAAPNSDDWTQLAYLHIAGIESVENGHEKRRGKGRR